jgi:hypothetical protein
LIVGSAEQRFSGKQLMCFTFFSLLQLCAKITKCKELLAKLEGRMDGSQLSPGAGSVTDDSSLAVNLLVQFMFRELRLQGAFRRLIIQKINQEMDEVLSKGQVRKIIRGLKVSEHLGHQAPT